MDGQSNDECLDQLGVDPLEEYMGSGCSATTCFDAYRAHMMCSIVNRIQGLGIEVQHIPTGCTYLCQPVDVGMNRSIKKEMTEQWEEWMICGGGIEDGVAKPPARRQVTEWIIGAYKSITKQTARNAWKKMGEQWFFY